VSNPGAPQFLAASIDCCVTSGGIVWDVHTRRHSIIVSLFRSCNTDNGALVLERSQLVILKEGDPDTDKAAGGSNQRGSRHQQRGCNVES
jgi:hypothetical protein